MVKPSFETILCDTAEARSVHYQLRYQVYCRETDFEDPNGFTDGEERDGYDRHSVHFVARDPLNRQWVAAMRLVLAGHGGLPLEKCCNISQVSEYLPIRHTIVEFSRFCVLQSHRRPNRNRSLGLRVVDGRSGEVKITQPGPGYPEIMLGLINATFAWSRKHDVRYCYFLVNRALARTLQRLNMELRPVGEPTEHHGLRAPYIMDLRASEYRMKQKLSVLRETSRQADHYHHYSELDENFLSTTLA